MKEFIKKMLSWFGPVQTPPPAQFPIMESSIITPVPVGDNSKTESAVNTNKSKKPKSNKNSSSNRPKTSSKQKSNTDVKKQETINRSTVKKPKKPRKSNNE